MTETFVSGDIRSSLHDWAALRAQIVFVFDSPLPDGGTDGSYERHNELSAWLIRKGRVRLEADGAHAEAGPGQWLICTGRQISQVLSPDVHILSVRIHHDWPNGRQLFRGGPLQVFPAGRPDRLEELALAMIRDFGKIEWLNNERSFAFLWKTKINYPTYLRQQIHLLMWLEELSGLLLRHRWELDIPGGMDARLAEALHILDYQRPGEAFPDREIRHASGLTLGQLNRICRESLGTTLYRYWDRRRAEWAMTALPLEQGSIKEVASELGFSQLSHFSAWFKRHTNRSPRAYVRDRAGAVPPVD